MSSSTWKSKLAALAAATCLCAPAAHAQSLSDTLIGAYNHSGLIQQNRAVLRAADEDVAQSVAALRPALEYSAGYTYGSTAFTSSSINETATGNVALTASLLLYDFGRTRLSIDAAKETVLATRDALKGIEQDVLLRALAAHMNVRRSIEFVSLAENSVRLIAEELRAAQDRFEVGEVTRTDVSLAEARLASARSTLAAAQGNLAQSREEYRAAVGVYPTSPGAPGALPRTAESLETARDISIRSHPDMAQAKRNVTISEINIARADSLKRPTVRGFADVTHNFGDLSTGNSRDDARVGLTLSGPIYQGGALASQSRQAIAQRDAARGALHVVRHALGQEVGNAWSAILVAEASVRAGTQQVRAAQEAFDGTREEAQLGARTTLDVLDAEQDLLDAQADLVSAQIDVYIATYQLLSSMGLMSVEHLGLNVPTYDPAAYYNSVRNAPAGLSAQGRELDRVLRAIGKQ
ncbi:TolC family outer membrane protein [Pseudoruegeria sp. SHC-113]|uniref:TolC family outer membrane protein n=1 Tax=Pseudoruegeria sp. SHC-113 TaxID=2855439 RepID=UPI0021BABEAC|nr:TolC family outer membrane protein [Pseudoruegeria sp. SHC-113]MCT8159534.1 TolC family outer membrane protein [Pseudoruegeria sp. SHC-113]